MPIANQMTKHVSLCLLIRMPQVRREYKCLVYIYMLWGCARVLASSKIWWTSVKSSSVCGVTTGAVAMKYNTRVGRLGQQKRLVIERQARESATRANANTGILLLFAAATLVWPNRSRRRSYEAKILGSSPSTSFLDGNKKANFRNSAIAARTRKRRLSTQLARLRAGCLQQSTKLIIVDTGFAHGQNRRVSGALPSNIRVTGNARGAERNAINTKTPA